MNESLSLAFQLLFVGMLTVFAVLFLVVGLGNVIIRLVNRFTSEDEKPAVASSSMASAPPALDPQKVAAISSAISILTKGKGKVINIEKV